MPDESSWNDSHRAFLQALMARGSITFEEAQPLLAQIQSLSERRDIRAGDITESDFSEYLSSVQSMVTPLDYEIRSTTHQVTGAKVWAFTNAASDGLTQAATGFTADEISFVKRVLDAIFETNNTKRREVCAIEGIKALHLSRPRDSQGNTQARQSQVNGATQNPGVTGGITQSNGEAVLKALVNQGWFELSRKGYYSLSPRALMELRGWLIETYNDNDESEDEGESRYSGQPIKMCQACKEIVTVGQRCADKNCPIRMHNMCTDRFFRMQKSSQCPKCKKDWEDHGVVGEKAAQAAAPRRSTGQAASWRSRITQLDGGADGEEEEG